MRYVRVKVRRDTQTTNSSLVPPWEVPILESMFEEGNVETLDFESSANPYPSDVAEEFGRLAKAYGEDPDTGVAHVANVFGSAGRGVKALAEAINEAREAEEAATPRKATSAKRGRPAKAVSASDPMLV